MQNELWERIENLPAEKQELLRLLLKQGNLTNVSRQTDKQAAQHTATEEALLPVWQDILKLNAIDVHDNFFKLGGDSLSATRLLYQVKQKFSVEFPVFKLIEMPTVNKLAAFIDTQLESLKLARDIQLMPDPGNVEYEAGEL